MTESCKNNGPVVIGGVGGSGTRVVARILEILGFYLGEDLNDARDNLWYTLLFKRPNWYYTNRDNKRAINTGLALLSDAMTDAVRPSLRELAFVSQAVVSMAFFGHNHRGGGKGLWSFKRAYRMMVAKKHRCSNHIGWGWKEPNSFLLIDRMAEFFKGFKYIHTIRHGLDMAYSRNQQQLFNWGPLYGVEVPRSQWDVQVASLQYWLRANQRAFQIGERIGKERFLAVNYDELCQFPRTGVQKIISFLDISPGREAFERASDIPKPPKSMGRYRGHDLSQFGRQDLSALREFGFTWQQRS